MVVVGGRSSANTKELTRLCEIVGTPVRPGPDLVRELTDPSVASGRRPIVGVTGGTSTPIEDLRDVASGSSSSPGRLSARANALELAEAALALAATPAGRTTSIPTPPSPSRRRLRP